VAKMRVAVSLAAAIALCAATPAILLASGSDDAVDDLVDDLDDIEFDEPDIEEPDIEEPEIEEPEIVEPEIEELEIEEPEVEEPEVEEPEVEEPEVEEPEVEEPEVEEPEVEEPEVEEPEVEEREVEEPEVEEPEVEEPEVEEPEVEEPEVEEPEVEEPEVEGPEVEEPEVEEPEVEEPEVEEPEVEDPEAGRSESDETDVDEPEDEADDFEEPEDEPATEIDDESDNSGSVSGSTSGNSSDDDSEEDEATDAAGAEAQMAEEWLAGLTQTQDPEFDDEGNPVRRGEIVALDLAEEAGAALLERGFVAVEVSQLEALGAELTTLRVPEGQSAWEGLALARAGDPAGIYDLGHYYASPYEPSTGRSSSVAHNAPVTPVRGNLRIGLIDTGITRTELPQRIGVTSRAFGRAGERSLAEHGTAVASILVAGGAGELVVANVFDNDGQRDFTSAQTIGSALSWLLDQQVEVVNISLAGPRNAVLDTLVHRAATRGTLIVAAAGNGGPSAPPAYPAALPDVVAVTAVDASQRIYRYANRGAYVRMATYGVRVPVELHGESSLVFTGTSFAAPRVAALLAACIDGGSTRQICVTRLERAARDLGEPGRDAVYGFGFVG